MNWNKTIGYTLLVLGLVLIIWTLWQTFNIFTDKASAPLIFKTQTEQQLSAGNSTDLQTQINQAIQKQFNQILLPATIAKILNLMAWTLLAWILIAVGGVVSRIGVKLLNGSKQ